MDTRTCMHIRTHTPMHAVDVCIPEELIEIPFSGTYLTISMGKKILLAAT